MSVVLALITGADAMAIDMSDSEIGDAIEDEFIFDSAISSNKIDIEVNTGVVALTGTVNNILAKDRAVRLAETVKGVRSVINRVEVRPSPLRTDSAVRSDVQSALLSDPATDLYDVDVSVDDGVVTLTGTVQSWTEKDLCGMVAKGVKGVIGLKNEIDLVTMSTRSDSEIQAEVEKALQWDTLVDHGLIDAEVNEGVVTLTGTVGSAAEKRRARYKAWVSGVKSVSDSQLTVARWARDEDLRNQKYVYRSPEDIKKAIEDALIYDPRVLSFNVTAEMKGSTVTLRGNVDNLKAKQAAEQVARHTVGVHLVNNRLKVRPLGDLSDAEIADDIEAALQRDPYVESYEITVGVLHGEAYLYGDVDSYFEKQQADEIASTVNGVEEVNNHLNVDREDPLSYDPYLFDDYFYDSDWYDYAPTYTFKTDTEIEEEIEDELWWSPFVDSDDVAVSVEDGIATLTGTVDSWSEFSAARENAYEGGAIGVDNDLIVASNHGG